MSLNLRQIEMFRAVMTAGTISGASELLCVSQPAISRLLSHTESRVGFVLFERIRGRLYATQEAKKLFREVEHVYQAVQRVNVLAKDLAENRSGILNVVSSPSIGQHIIPEAISQFRELHPDVKVTFQCLAYSYLKERLINRQADLGIAIMPIEHPILDVQPLCVSPVVCALPYSHPLAHRSELTLEDLRPYPFISYERETPFGRMVQQLFDSQDEPLRPIMEVGSPQNACALVQMRTGIALVDAYSVRSWSGDGKIVVRPLRNSPSIQANLAHVRQEPLSKPAQIFISVLKKLLVRDGFELMQATA